MYLYLKVTITPTKNPGEVVEFGQFEMVVAGVLSMSRHSLLG
jgi:hypothetical protein